MKIRINSLLNIKPAEAGLVKQLFLVQFFLGVATSFLLTGALTLFLTTYPVKEIPWVFLLTAVLLFVANFIYARLEAKVSAKKLLQVITLFSLGSILFTWLEATFFRVTWLPFFLSAWNMVVYMVVGYGFWGMAAIIFNVRESKRIFSVVGSGDIPAKIIGYGAVAALSPVIGIVNVLALSVVAFGIAYYFLSQFQHPVINHSPDHSSASYSETEDQTGWTVRFFHNHLIMVIAIWSFFGFTIYSLMDYTFLTEVKVKYTTSHQLASFLGIFFALGRLIAMFLKLLFSSRVINRLGLTNALLITPAALLLITSFILVAGNSLNATLLIFGIMVLFSEILKSAVQEPAFFVLFQPLKPHARLKGHLITKGYTLPFALLVVGGFAFIFRDERGEISINLVCGTLIVLLLTWAALVFLIKKEYLRTLINALKKGYFTGSQLFLNDQPVRDLLLVKTKSEKPKEVLFALELLERSDYKKLDELLLNQLFNASTLVKKFVLSRIISRNITAALPIVRQELKKSPDSDLKPDLIKTLYYLHPNQSDDLSEIRNFDLITKKAALLGLAAQTQLPVLNLVEHEVATLAASVREEDKSLTLDIITEAARGNFYAGLKALLQAPQAGICKKAIEAVGQVREFRLWPEVIEVTQQHKAWAAFQKAIWYFKDPIFAPDYTSNISLPENIILTLVKAAGKVEGNNSTAFLLKLLQPDSPFKDAALGALFQKNAYLSGAAQTQVMTWLENKLRQCQLKINLYTPLARHGSAALLTTAIHSEIKQDLSLILQAFALVYDRQRLERVLQLIHASGDTRLFNAIEMLELSIPKRYFLQVDVILEFLLDNNEAVITQNNPSLEVLTSAIKAILTTSEAGFNIWTKSVALYLIPDLISGLKENSFKEALTGKQVEENNPLFSETKKFVLSQVEL